MRHSAWKRFLVSADRLAEAWDAAIRLHMQAVFALLRQPEFWISLLWVLLASGMLLGLAWLAVSQYDAFLRLKPELCTKSLSNERLLLIVMLVPLGLVSTLVASTELMAIRKRERVKGWAGTQYFWIYAALMLVSWSALLWAMRC